LQKTLFSILFLLSFFFISPETALATSAEKLNLLLCDRVEQCSAELSASPGNEESHTMKSWLAEIYDKTGLHPLWVTQDGPGEKAAILFSVLKNSAMDGLAPEQYKISRITSLWDGKSAEELIDLDTLLTFALVMYAHDARGGRDPSRKSSAISTSALEATALVEAALSSSDFSQFLADLLPPHRYYKNLRAALPNYQSMAAAGGWPAIEAGKSIHPGEEDSRIPEIKKRLQIEGFLQSVTTDPTENDEAFVQAVIRFQERHGLAGDGVIGKLTIAAMNVPAQKKVRKIIINLERWRGESHDLGSKYVLVDIAGFTLEAIADDTVVLEMAVVVGTQQNKTPLFSDQIQYIETNPFWNIPASIARNEMLGELRKNPSYLTSNHIRLFNDWSSEAREINPLSINWKQVSQKKMGQFKLRQEPGKKNALGSIKFVFPNSYDVYMHDTPAQTLFQRSSRAFSHGCIRLEKPVDLAVFLMNNGENGWPMERFQAMIATGKRTIIRLPEPLPIHITYQTVKSDQNGTLSFHTDIYDRDRQLEQILFTE
jgi:murein L,D-transpeptidase YcbB/YkuD